MVGKSIDVIKKDTKRRMDGAVEVLHKEYGGLRTGRAATQAPSPLTSWKRRGRETPTW